jgi:hypothetical protein
VSHTSHAVHLDAPGAVAETIAGTR